MIYTLNSFINLIEVNFADNHLGIRSFNYGFYDDLTMFATKDEQYAKMYIVINDIDHLDNSVSQYNIRVYFIDLLENDNDNQNDVLSDQLSISRDFINWCRLNEDSFTVLNTPTSVPVRSIASDYIGGWYTDISLEVPIEGSDCSIPFTGVTGSTIGCPTLTVSLSDNVINPNDSITITATANSGFIPTSYQFLLLDGTITILAQQTGNTFTWTANVPEDSYDIYVLATDGITNVFDSQSINVATS